MHHHGVGGRDIETTFDNRRRQQHVVFAVIKGVHLVVELACRHLPMRHDIRDLRHLILEKLLDLAQIADPRHHIEALAAAVVFAQERLADGHRVELADISADRQPVDRRRADDREIAYAGERELQGARDRRRGQGQHVDIGAQLLQPLLVRDAEMLLFVDDQQPEILKPDALGQKRMGADDDIRRAFGNALAGERRIARRDKARQRPDIDREATEALGKALVMLPCQQRRRRDHRHLHARHGGHESGAHRHLGLAKAHVAADQPVHRLAGMHVVHHIGNGAQLVVGLLVGEARREILVGAMRRVHHRRLAQRTLGRDADQPVGHLADAFLQLGLLGLPGAAAKLVEQTGLMAVFRQ